MNVDRIQDLWKTFKGLVDPDIDPRDSFWSFELMEIDRFIQINEGHTLKAEETLRDLLFPANRWNEKWASLDLVGVSVFKDCVMFNIAGDAKYLDGLRDAIAFSTGMPINKVRFKIVKETNHV